MHQRDLKVMAGVAAVVLIGNIDHGSMYMDIDSEKHSH
jgi:hypothetical protein